MALPLAVMIGSQVINSGYQAYKSGQQKKMAKNLRPSNYIPPELKKQLSADERRASINQTKRQIRTNQQIDNTTANTANRIAKVGGSAADVIGAISAVDAKAKNAKIENEVVAEQEMEMRRDKLGRTRENVARIQLKNQDEYEAAKSALTGASDQNMFNAITGITSTASYLAGSGKLSGKTADNGFYTPGKEAVPDLTPGMSAQRDTPVPSDKLVIPTNMTGNDVDITDYILRNKKNNFAYEDPYERLIRG